MADRPLSIVFFGEDTGHLAVAVPLIRSVADELGVAVDIDPRSAAHGYGTAVTAFRRYMLQLTLFPAQAPDIVVAAVDANCHGLPARRDEVLAAAGPRTDLVVPAIADPHIERWLLADSAAFKAVLGKGCPQPPAKCERDLFKRLLIEAVRDAGREPVQHGLEYAADIVAAMDLRKPRDASQAAFVKDLRAALTQAAHL